MPSSGNRSKSWDMKTSSTTSKSSKKNYIIPQHLTRQDSEIRQQQLEADEEYNIEVVGTDGTANIKIIKLYDNLLDTVNPDRKFWSKHKLVIVGLPSVKFRFHNTLEDAVAKGADLTNLQAIVKKRSLRSRISKSVRKMLKRGGSRKKRR
jgi:hypothetical protein